MKLVLLGLFVLSFNSFAGERGNGGVSVVCRDINKKIISAEVLDIYEGTIRFGRKYDNTFEVESRIDSAQKMLTTNSDFLIKFQNELAKVRANLTFVPKGNSLTPTNDAFPPIKKDGCDFEQLANYTSKNELLVSQEIYDELDTLNQAALLVHEAVYTIFRTQGDKDSQRSRKLTAQLLAVNADQRMINEMIGANHNRICGLQGSIQERITDCNFLKGGFALVKRSEDRKEIYKDLASGLLWSDRLEDKLIFKATDQWCKKELEGFNGIDWVVPSKSDFRVADRNGIGRFLPNMDLPLWTSKAEVVFIPKVGEFQGVETNYGYRFHVRCVAK